MDLANCKLAHNLRFFSHSRERMRKGSYFPCSLRYALHEYNALAAGGIDSVARQRKWGHNGAYAVAKWGRILSLDATAIVAELVQESLATCTSKESSTPNMIQFLPSPPEPSSS